MMLESTRPNAGAGKLLASGCPLKQVAKSAGTEGFSMIAIMDACGTGNEAVELLLVSLAPTEAGRREDEASTRPMARLGGPRAISEAVRQVLARYQLAEELADPIGPSFTSEATACVARRNA